MECHHAKAYLIYEKIRAENPDMDPQTAVNHASFVKNSDMNVTEFSPSKITMGKNHSFPGLAETTPASSNWSSTKIMKALKYIDDVSIESMSVMKT